MPRLELYPFRYRDRLTGKWVKARYVASRKDIAARYAEWEIIGPPEIRDFDPNERYFTPWKIVPHAELVRMQELAPQLNPQLDRPPTVDAVECVLLSLFLRRYITYCGRRRRHAEMQGAARLYREVAAADEALM